MSTPPSPAATAARHHGEDRPLYALGIRLLSMLAISLMFAGVKLASERGVHVVETLFFRQLLSLPVVLIGLWMGPGLASVRTKNIGAHAGRTVLGMSGMVLNFVSFTMLPLAEATTISFSIPLFATILSALVLREFVGIHRWSAVLIGFAGVLFIARPSAHPDMPTTGLMVGVSAALVTAMISIIVRRLSRTEAPTTTVFWFSILSLPVLGALMPFYAQSHDPLTWWLLIGLGVIGGIAQLFMTISLRWGAISLVLPMDYSTLLWSTVLGFYLWNTWPKNETWAGAVLIVGSGLYIAWREHKRLREVRSAVTVSP